MQYQTKCNYHNCKNMHTLHSCKITINIVLFSFTGNPMTLFDFELAGVEGSPDGMTIDVDGNLWVASVFGSRVIKVDGDTGELLQQVYELRS